MPQGHDLSDVALADALFDRAELTRGSAGRRPVEWSAEGSFRRYCGFARGETTPERPSAPPA
ncbi:MAG: hypothetical protein WA624_18470 [Methylocella sp.]